MAEQSAMIARTRKLLSRGSIGRLQVKNRIFMPAMGTYFTDPHGGPTELLKEFYVDRARGGVGLIITEMHAVEPRGRSNARQLGLWSQEQALALRSMIHAIKDEGARVIAQISHAGRQTSSSVAGETPVAPTAGVTCERYPEAPRSLEVDEISAIVHHFGRTAELAVLAGYDGIELHGAHGFLIAQFLSRFSNRRQDAYGGSLASRMRFAQEVVAAVRSAIGLERALIVRLSLYEGISRGLVPAEAYRIAAGLEEAGADAIDASAGIVANRRLYCAPAAVARGHLVPVARELRKWTKMALLVPGRIVTPMQAERILAGQDADMVGMARALLVDPELPNKARENREIKSCIGCHQGCRSHPISCMINSALGRTSHTERTPVAQPRRIMVIGAGPAGVECAITAARRGHHVFIYEKETRIGGQLLIGASPPSKQDIHEYLAFQRNELQRLGVHLHTGVKANVDCVRKERPDQLIIATGSRPRRPSVQGSAFCILPEQALMLHQVPANVIIIGGGETGAETADYLSARGAKVTIVGSSCKLAGEMPPDPHHYLLKRLNRSKVTIRLSSYVQEVDPTRVIVADCAGRWAIPTDLVVLATGIESNVPDFLDGWSDCLVDVIGDARQIGNAKSAILEGYLCGSRL